MIRLMMAAALTAMLTQAAPARAAQLCAWMVEALEPNDVHHVTLYLTSDRAVEFLYRIGGSGLVDGSGRSHSPASGTYLLHPGETANPWSFGATLNPPGRIDIKVEIHDKPADIFDDKPTPLLAGFTFARNLPDGETKPPAVLARKQCTTLK